MRWDNMETMDLLLLIKNTYGLALVMKNDLADLKLDRKLQTGFNALVDTIEQNLYNIHIEVEELINLH